jgi:hypothetical protein
MSMILTWPLIKRRVSYFVDVGAAIAFPNNVLQPGIGLGPIYQFCTAIYLRFAPAVMA